MTLGELEMNSNHTPGHWYNVEPMTLSSPTHRVITGGEHGIPHIAYVPRNSYGAVEEEALANAQLISAAPDLLDALKRFVTFAGEPCQPGDYGTKICQHRDCKAVRMAQAAITKATEKS